MRAPNVDVTNFPVDPSQRRDVARTLADRGYSLPPHVAKYASDTPNADMAVLIEARQNYVAPSKPEHLQYGQLAKVANIVNAEDVFEALVRLDYDAGIRVTDYEHKNIPDPVMVVWGPAASTYMQHKSAEYQFADALLCAVEDAQVVKALDGLFGHGTAHKIASDPVTGLSSFNPASLRIIAQTCGVDAMLLRKLAAQ